MSEQRTNHDEIPISDPVAIARLGRILSLLAAEQQVEVWCGTTLRLAEKLYWQNHERPGDQTQDEGGNRDDQRRP